MRVPPPGDLGSDQAVADFRNQVTAEDDQDRRGRYWAAMACGEANLDAVMRLVDTEHADTRKAVERGLDLADAWESTDPDGLMSRRRAAAILREVLDP